jgi:phosphatidylglycerol:prolipoprotein diacylglycerol transferase
LGPFTLHTFGLLVAVGFIFAYRTFLKRAPKIPLTETEASTLMVLLLLSGVFGARAYYVIWRWNEEFSGNWREIPMIHHGGLVFFGGFLAAILALMVWVRVKRLKFTLLADALAPALVIGHFWGRLGCFMNGCCYGIRCEAPWGVRFPSVSPEPLHPTQLYEALGLAEVYVALLVIEKIARYPGQVACSYLMLYSLLRFIVEYYRGDVPRELWDKWTTAQGISVIIFLGSWLISARLANLAAKKRIQERRVALEREIQSND